MVCKQLHVWKQVQRKRFEMELCSQLLYLNPTPPFLPFKNGLNINNIITNVIVYY